MTMPRYAALVEQWNEIPPVDLMIAAYFEVGLFDKKRRPSQTAEVGLDSRGLPIVQKPGQANPQWKTVAPQTAPQQRPPTLDEKPGTMKDLVAAFGLKPGQSVAF